MRYYKFYSNLILLTGGKGPNEDIIQTTKLERTRQ
nr:MAG TPA: hypothetical protein [Caudoviricetes sp.]DAU31545.1 MAG TPA: hypothetical protein [Caudoviricetes sp.]